MRKPKRFVAVADSHGNEVDPASDAAVMAFIKDFKPTIRIHLGDAFNFVALRKGASDEERAVGLQEDWEAGKDFLTRFFEKGEENFFLEGNHDRVRLENFSSSSNGLQRERAQQGIQDLDYLIRRTRCTRFPYDSRLGVLRLGHMKFVHGYAAGVSATQRHARVYGNVCHGHTHTIECIAVESDDGPKEARAIGALCKIDMPYNARQINKLRHSNGFAYGFLFDNGDYQIFQARKIDGSFYAASNITSYQ